MSTSEGKRYEDMTVVEKLRNKFETDETPELIRLHLEHAFFKQPFIHECIRDVERLAVRIQMEDKISNLEKLAYLLLCDSAYIEFKQSERKES